jgi:5-methylcytosine-specific restriction endonuclease McrA
MTAPGKRKEALDAKQDRFYTGQPCSKGHICERYSISGQCIECAALFRAAHSVKHKIYREKHYAENAATYKEKAKTWKKENRGQVLHLRKYERMRLLQRVPKWLSKAHKQSINEIYSTARLVSEMTGELFHVDHIVPLRGKNVSGLHVPWNLQVLRAHDNLIKHNIFNQE